MKITSEQRLRIPEDPIRLFCTNCKREVWQTTHRAFDYYVDWYRSAQTNNQVVCIDCYDEVVKS